MPETETPQKSTAMTHSEKNLAAEVRALFQEPGVSDEIALRFLEKLDQNLYTTEKAISAGLLRITLFFIAFLLLDTGLVEKVSISGAELERSGTLLLIFPMIIAFLMFQMGSRVTFAHDIRTAIALMYKELAPQIYDAGLDLLTHYPSVRNIESYYGKLVLGRGRALLEFSTTVVVVVITILPLVAIGYCFVRTFAAPDVSTWVWLTAVLISVGLIFHTLVMDMFTPFKRNEEYVSRR